MKRSLIPVILVAVAAALCLSAAFAGDEGNTGEKEVTLSFGEGVSYEVSGTVTGGSPSAPIEGATVTFSSDNEIYTTTTNLAGEYLLYVNPGTYDLTITKIGYVTKSEKNISISSDVSGKDVTINEKTNVNGSTLTGHVIALDDFARYSGSDVSIRLYYRTSDTETAVFSDYVEMASANSIDIVNGTFTLTGVKHGNDTLVDRCYLRISVKSYDVTDYSSSDFTNKIVIGSTGTEIVLYHLNEDISTTGSFEEDGSYDLGKPTSAAIIFKPIDGTVTGTVKCSSTLIEGATVTFSSDNGTYTTTTNSAGKYLLYVKPGTYDLTITKIGYVTKSEKNISISSDVSGVIKDVTINEKTNVNGSTLTGYVMVLNEFSKFTDSTVNIKLYYKIADTGTFVNDYVELQSTNVKNGYKFTINNVKYDLAENKDTLVEKCYIMISFDTFTVESVSPSYIIGEPKTYTDLTTNIITTLYQLNEDISTTGSFEDNGDYSLGTSDSAAIVLKPAKGTVTGTMNTVGTVTITDSTGKVYGQGSADTNGYYSVGTYVGKDLTITYSSIGYKSKSLTLTVYDDKVSPKKNIQPDVKLTEIESGKATVKFYIDGKTSNIADITQGKYVLYQLLNPSEPDQSKRSYRAIAEYTSALIKDIEKDKVKGYYFEFTINGDISCSDCFLSIQISGYSVRTVQSEFMEMAQTIITSDEISTNRLKSSVSSNGRFETGHEYSVGTCSSDAILIDSATGTVKGDVVTDTESPTILNGVKVSIIDKNNNSVIAYGITSNDGSYSIKVATGDYKIRYEVEGYTTYESTVKVYDESIYDPQKNVQPTVKLTAEKGEWFGMDLPHALLVLGGVIAVILICAVLYHRFRILGKKKNVIFEDEDDERE